MHPSRHLRPALSAVLCTLLLGSLATTAQADEIRLQDGRVLIGSVKKMDGGARILIKTRNGTVEVSADEVKAIRSNRVLRAELKQLEKSAGTSAFGQLNLARMAKGYELEAEMWGHLDKCLAGIDPKKPSTTGRKLKTLLTELETDIIPSRFAQADTKKRVLGIVRLVRPGFSTAKRAVVVQALSHTPEADEILRDQAIRGYLPEHRLTATAALKNRPAKGNDRFALFRTLKDNDKKNRIAVANLYRDQAGKASQRLAPGLLHDNPEIRIRSAEAFANLGAAEGAALLALAGPRAGLPAAAGDGPSGVRAHMFSLTHQSYIKDFDVEIAQAAAVANPIVGTLSHGVVLDVNVAAVTTMQVPIERAYRRALHQIVGKDPGANPKAWVAWLKQADPEAAKLLAQR